MRSIGLTVALIALSLSLALGQQPEELKHLAMTISPKGWSVRISAENMARESTVLHLKGAVEIALQNGADNYLLMHADQADFHIDTGAIEPQGKVSVELHNGRLK
jgi:hypothetical protein